MMQSSRYLAKGDTWPRALGPGISLDRVSGVCGAGATLSISHIHLLGFRRRRFDVRHKLAKLNPISNNPKARFVSI